MTEVVCLAASCREHSDSIPMLRRLCVSIADQTQVVGVFVGISGPLASVKRRADFGQLQEAFQGITFVNLGAEPKTQFQAYKSLVSNLTDAVVWVMFSDDDDIWHPTRVAMVQECRQDTAALAAVAAAAADAHTV